LTAMLHTELSERLLDTLFEEFGKLRVMYSLLRKGKKICLYLNIGRRDTRIACTSEKYALDIVEYATKLSREVYEDRIVLDEESGDKVLIYMRVRPILQSYSRVVKLQKVINKLEIAELWFWAWKIREEPRRAPVAFIRLYGI